MFENDPRLAADPAAGLLPLPNPTTPSQPLAAPATLGLPAGLGPIAAAPPQVKLRRTDDATALRQSVYDSVLNAASQMAPIEGPTHTLRAVDVHYAKDDPEFDRAAEKRARLERTSLNRRLRGTWQLLDNATGDVVSERKATMANVPAVLQDGSIMHRGTKYMMGYQQRLRPGVYVRRRNNGELESHVNAKPGHGRSHRYVLTPETGLFHINVEHAKIPLVPLLEVLGASRDDMRAAWGEELAEQNFKKTDPKSVSKLYDRLVPKKLRDEDDRADPARMKDKIREAFADMKVDPAVVRRTLGREADTVDADMILRATAKTLRVQRQEEDQDDRDHLAYATFHSAPDIFSERFTKDYGRLRSELLRKAVRRGDLGSVPSAALDKQIDAAIFKSGIANTTEEINPLALLTEMTRVTRYGEGGLPSVTATPKESRNVNPGQFGFIDIATTPESTKIGVDGFLAKNTYVGDDNQLYTDVIDAKTGEKVQRSASDVMDATLEFAGSPIPGRAMAIRKGKMSFIKQGSGDYMLPDFEELFSHAANITPLKSSMFAQRGSMASRMAGQALSLEKPEAPWVQTGVQGQPGVSHDDLLGERLGAVRSPGNGRVMEVTPEYMAVKYAGGEVKRFSLDNNRPGARKSLFHNTPLVKVGDDVTEGQLLAKSNYTDDNGTAAMGRNLRVGLMALEDNWEDGFVISESASKALKVQQAYTHGIESGEGKEVDKKRFLQTFGGTYEPEQLKAIDDDGAVQVGTTVKKGDPLLLAWRERDGVTDRVHQKGRSNFIDSSLTWDHNHDGVVTDVVKSPKGVQVVVKTSQALQVGSKISGRAGNKGVVDIWPDDQMPHDAEGNPIDIAISPQAVPSRGNSSFPIELVLGKIAKQRGEAYKIVDGEHPDMAAFAAEEAKKYGVDQTETLIDPRTGRKIPGILTGQMFTMALHHQAESKQSSRGLGNYTAEGQPARGKGEGAGAKRFSGQQLYSSLSHGAYDYAREGSLLRGKRNDDYWSAFMAGDQLGEPRVSEQYEAFVDRLKGAGINPVKRGGKTQLMAMTDKDIDKLSGGRVVTSAETFDNAKRRKEITGGLFDPKIFGDGDKFAQIELPESMPNPVFEEPLRRLLGVTEKQFRDTLAGTRELGDYGSGPEAITKRLQAMDIDQELKKAREEIKGTRKVARDAAVRRMTFLKGLQRTGVKPADLMVTKIPVVPPRLRPITEMQGKGGLMVNDANFLYRELMHAGENLKGLKDQVDDVSEERLALYDAHKALVGLSESRNPELRQRKVAGLLKSVLGKNSPKGGMMQRKLLSGNVDTVGRGVIMVDSNLDMDTIGLPESMAFNIFQPYIIRNLVSSGVPKVTAMEYAKEKHPRAREALLQVMKERPVTASRAPILHKYGDLGQWATLVKGDAIRYNPHITPPQGGDFDGDQQIGHVVLAVPEDAWHSRHAGDTVREMFADSAFRLAEIDMASLTRMGVPVLAGHAALVCDLEDFPKGKKSRESNGRCGTIDWHEVPAGVRVLTIGDGPDDLRWSKVSAWSHHRGCSVVVVNTQSGRQVFTDDDPRGLLVCEPQSGSFALQTISPLSIGERFVMIPRAAKLTTVCDAAVNKRYMKTPRVMTERKANGKPGAVMVDRIPLDNDTGWFLGAFVGNGWTTMDSESKTNYRQLNICSSSEAVLENFYRVGKQLLRDPLGEGFVPAFTKNYRKGGGDAESGYGDTIRGTLSNGKVAAWVSKQCGRGAGAKRLPPMFVTACEEFRHGLLAGLMDTDGCMAALRAKAKTQAQLSCSYSTISLRLAREVSLLARSLGIPASVRFSKVTDSGNDAWIVLFGAYEFRQWALAQRKRMVYIERFKPVLEIEVTGPETSSVAARQDKVPVTPQLLDHIDQRLTGRKSSPEWTTLTSAMNLAKRTGRFALTRVTAKRALRLAEPVDPHLLAHWRQWADLVACEDVTWDAVTDVQDTGEVQDGYDLSVPGPENWMNESGLFVPNTVNIHVPHSPRAVGEVIDRMMPSKMLHDIKDFRSAVFRPSQDMLLGLHEAARPADKNKRLRIFASKAEMLAAFRRGEIDVDTPVRFPGS